METCETCHGVVQLDGFLEVLYDRAFAMGRAAHFCSRRCRDVCLYARYSLCKACKRYIRRHFNGHGDQWRRLGVFARGEERMNDFRCLSCYESSVLRHGQCTDRFLRLHRVPDTALITDAESVVRWAAAGFTPLVLDYNRYKWYDQMKPVITDVRCDKWFLAFRVQQPNIVLYVHAREFHREAVRAAVTFLLCVKRCARAGLMDVARYLIATPIAKSGLDPVWADAYVGAKRSKSNENL